MPDARYRDSMLLPSVHRELLWWTWRVSVEYHGLVFIVFFLGTPATRLPAPRRVIWTLPGAGRVVSI